MTEISYQSAGVNIKVGNEIVNRIKDKVKTTFTSNILSSLGGFAASIDLKQIVAEYEHPVLVQSIDGLGTKTIIARMMNRYNTLGADLLSATSNDILVVGAKPITLLDYIASSHLEPDTIETILEGMIKACKEENVALVGGETAEMPNTYLPQEHDIVGIVTGIVEKEKRVTGEKIKPKNKILGLTSSGLHTNGYSLARKLFFETESYSVDTHLPELQKTIGEALIVPHLNYTQLVLDLLNQNIQINGMVHITGGGFIENIPRILPENCTAEIDTHSWKHPALFEIMQKIGNISEKEMYTTFNMGIGFILIVEEQAVTPIKETLKNYKESKLIEIGTITSGYKEVKLI